MLWNDTQQDFMVTTLLGNADTVKKYLNIDRSNYFANSGIRNVQGNVNGWDVYGKMPSDRMVYDLSDAANQITIANDNMIGIDAMETASVYILEDTSRETTMDLERSTSFSYTLKFVTILNQEDGNPVVLLT